MGTEFNDAVLVFIFYGAVAVAIGPDMLREIRHRRSDTEAVKTRDEGSKRVIGAAGASGILAGVAAAYAVPVLTILEDARVIFVVGIAVLLLGSGFRQYAVRTLDEYFTSTVKIHHGQQVVDTGPYRWVRHPSYTGGLIQYSGIALVLNNWISLGVIVGPLGIAYLYRIRIEERALSEELGEPYLEYLERTPYRLIPYVW